MTKRYEDIGHYNVFNQFLAKKIAFLQLNELDGVKLCQEFTCLSSMGEASVGDYLIGDPNSLHNFISNFSVGFK